jgi:predicted N-formylglutamate amidohydrolase
LQNTFCTIGGKMSGAVCCYRSYLPQGARITPLLLLCDHASPNCPDEFNQLGLSAQIWQRHIAYDIGAALLCEYLAKHLGAEALLHAVSRLVIDPNRAPHDPTLICAISDGCLIPGNAPNGQPLPVVERERRLALYHRPYHNAISHALHVRRKAKFTPILLSVHSFTPTLRNGPPRPWHIGVLWGRDGRLALPMLQHLAAQAGIFVGDNQPYSGANGHGYTLDYHAWPEEGPPLPHLLLEVRQDLLTTPTDIAHWGACIAQALEASFTSAGLAWRSS